MYRETGWIMGGHEKTKPWSQSSYKTAKAVGHKGVEFLGVSDIRTRWPSLTGAFDGRMSLWSPAAAWVPSAQALLCMANAARASGVKYCYGDAGYAKRLVYDEATGAYIGAVTADGTMYKADLVVATGANTATLIPEAGNEAVAQCSAICVMQLTNGKAIKYKDISIVEDFEQAIFFPPDENNLIELCSCRYLTNHNSKHLPGASILHSLSDYPYDGCPKEVEDEMRTFMAGVTPELENRHFISTKMCW